MPYIKKERRDELIKYYPEGMSINTRNIVGPGELNFAITSLVLDVIMSNQLSYKDINDVMGALECAKLEFYRRVAAPYENKKKEENGDVY